MKSITADEYAALCAVADAAEALDAHYALPASKRLANASDLINAIRESVANLAAVRNGGAK